MSIQKTLALNSPVVALPIKIYGIKKVLHFVISEQTVIISTHIINSLVFIIKVECSCCAVQSESISEIKVNFHLSVVNSIIL
jgi:hypothetical protein